MVKSATIKLQVPTIAFISGRVARSRKPRSVARARHDRADAAHADIEPLDRRQTFMFAAALGLAALHPAAVLAAGNQAVTAGLQRYIRKKKLDAIDSYLAPLLNASDQLIRVGRVMLQDPAAARKLLRSGAFGGVRDSVRAMGEFVARERGQQAGAALAGDFISSLEAFDQELLKESRESGSGREEAQAKLAACSAALDRLLAAAPDDALQQARRVLEGALAEPEGDGASAGQGSNDELTRLQQLL